MLEFDHIVIAARDPKKAAEQFSKEHNVEVIQGGKHENWGTYNYLAYFSNQCYIEWLGVFDQAKTLQTDNPLVTQLIRILEKHDEYIYQFALRTNSMADHVHHFHENNIPFYGPINGSRKKTDGSIMEWKMLFPTPENDHLYPFLIEWGKTKNMPEDKNLINHQRLASLILRQEDLEQFSQVYQLPITDHHIQLKNTSLLFSNRTKELIKLKVD